MAKTKMVRVKLLKTHQHGEAVYQAGIEIEVPEHTAQWLKNLKIAKAINQNVHSIEEQQDA